MVVNGSKNDISSCKIYIFGLLQLGLDIYYLKILTASYLLSSRAVNFITLHSLIFFECCTLFIDHQYSHRHCPIFTTGSVQWSLLIILFICCFIQYLPQSYIFSFLVILSFHQANEFGKFLKWLHIIIDIVQQKTANLFI